MKSHDETSKDVRPPTAVELDAMCQLYGVDAATRDTLAATGMSYSEVRKWLSANLVTARS